MRPMAVTPSKTTYDVVIIGGAMYGAAIAWFLISNSDFNGSILVVEKDPTYEFAATSRTNSCMRQQFSHGINVRISQFAAEYVKNFRDYMGGDPRIPDLAFQSFGYLYLANNEAFADVLRENQKTQAACGAGTVLMDAAEISREYPFYNLEDIVVGSHNKIDEGYFDGATMVDWWRRSARERGVEYISNEVTGLTKNDYGDAVEVVTLKSGNAISCGVVVNAAGCWSVKVARMLGIDIPIESRKRYTYIFDAQKPLDRDLPLTIDPSGVHVRSDSAYYLAGCAPPNDPPVEQEDFTADHSLWEDLVWPTLAHRIPQFDAVKVINSWVGHYDFNTVDQNAILGAHTSVQNFYFATGFSGHGFQQAPALGRGMAELLTYGEYRSLDLSPFTYDRFARGAPIVEKAVI